MDPITIVTAASAALKLAEALLPQVQALYQRGQVTLKQQQDLMARYHALKTQAEGQFAGPEWAMAKKRKS